MVVRVFILCLSLCLLSSCDSREDVKNQPENGTQQPKQSQPQVSKKTNQPENGTQQPKQSQPQVSKDMPPGEVSMFDGQKLGQWKSSAFDEPGKVYVKDGNIILERGNNLTGITWDGSVPSVNYEVNFDAMRLEGGDFFSALTFPVEDTFVTFVAGGWTNNVCGISSVDYYDASDNETTVKSCFFENNRWFHFRVRVTAGKIQCWIDKKQYVDLDTAGKELDVRVEVEESKPLGIASWKSSSMIKNISLTRLPDTPGSL